MAIEGKLIESPISIKIGENHIIGPNEKCFIIAELGQNHQGDINMAKKMILVAKESGADCVKFQKTHLPSKFNKEALLRPYNGPHSWGSTYGSHKKHLEFDEKTFIDLQKFSKENDILFSSSAMDIVSLKFLDYLNIPFIKIGSGDFHNLQLLEQAASLGKPLILSTGMSNLEEVIKVYEMLKMKKAKFCLLHCVSSYPAPFEEINLNVLNTFKKLFPDINIGYSGHELGIDVALAAVALGAKVIEKHFTLDKSLKGTDHICSLTPVEFKEMVFSIRNFESGKMRKNLIFKKNIIQKALGGYDKVFQNSELACFEKLGKSVVAAKKLNKNEVINWENICIKVSEPKGILGVNAINIIGKTVNRIIEEDESIMEKDINY